ncbi:MAG: hypothetical protein B1H06_00885 [Candidatus Cloacimonas sp. 4484_143]|nr:MAG: hypothetical protein B1H06_00885 [Candidatus Cloacimonas sp. 4484_143]
MKLSKYLLILIIASSIVLQAEEIGFVSFILGEAEYKINRNAEWKALDIDSIVHETGIIKTGLDTELEITWKHNNQISTLTSEQEISIKQLMIDASKESSWDEKFTSKLNTLFTEANSNEANTVAGIRKSEVELDKESELHWKTEEEVDLKTGVDAFQAQNLGSAIQVFKAVIEMNPLSPDAEFARAYLALSYFLTNRKTEAKEQLTILEKDFPNSVLIEQIKQGIDIIE